MESLSETARRRVEQTVAVRDTDGIPKVADAGRVVDRAGRRVQIMQAVRSWRPAATTATG